MFDPTYSKDKYSGMHIRQLERWDVKIQGPIWGTLVCRNVESLQMHDLTETKVNRPQLIFTS